MKAILVSIASCFVAGAGCDSVGYNQMLEDVSAPVNHVYVVETIPDTSLFLNDSMTIGPVSDFFQFGLTTSKSFSAWSSSPAISTEITPEFGLLLRGNKTGVSEISVVGQDKFGGADTLSFQVSVKEHCPIDASPEGFANYFPLAGGQRHIFSYSHHYHDEIETRKTLGKILWEIDSAVDCFRGIQTFSIRETLEATVTKTVAYWGDSTAVYPAESERTLTFMVDQDSISAPPYSIRRLPRFLPVETPDSVLFNDKPATPVFASNPGWWTQIVLVRGRGISSRSHFNHLGVRSNVQEDLSLE